MYLLNRETDMKNLTNQNIEAAALAIIEEFGNTTAVEVAAQAAEFQGIEITEANEAALMSQVAATLPAILEDIAKQDAAEAAHKAAKAEIAADQELQAWKAAKAIEYRAKLIASAEGKKIQIYSCNYCKSMRY